MSGLISLDELRIILESYGIYLTYSDVGHLMDRIDRNKDGLISLKEFSQELSPRSRRLNK